MVQYIKAKILEGREASYSLLKIIYLAIKAHIGTIIANSIFIVGSGENIHFWKDNLIGEPLVDLLHIDPRYHDRSHGSVAFVIHNGSWDLPSALMAIPDVTTRLVSVIVPTSPLPDSLVWMHSADGLLTTKQAFLFLNPAPISLQWATLIWKPSIPPSLFFLAGLCIAKFPLTRIFRPVGA